MRTNPYVDCDPDADPYARTDQREGVLYCLGSVLFVWVFSIASWLALLATFPFTFDLGSLGVGGHQTPAWAHALEVVATGGSVGGPLLGAVACWVVGAHVAERRRALVPFGIWTAVAGSGPLAILAALVLYVA